MAVDKSEPRMGLILGVTVLAIVGFVLLRWAMISYFWMETDAEEYAKYSSARPDQRIRLRTAQIERLQNGPVPIDQAIHLVAAGTRPAVIEPRPSNDVGPMQGWSQRPLAFTAPPAVGGTNPAPTPPIGAPPAAAPAAGPPPTGAAPAAGSPSTAGAPAGAGPVAPAGAVPTAGPPPTGAAPAAGPPPSAAAPAPAEGAQH
jgi:hypothetical protein